MGMQDRSPESAEEHLNIAKGTSNRNMTHRMSIARMCV